MITFIRINGRSCPLVFCDQCGKQITEPRLGMVLFSDDIGEEGEQCKPIFLHKGECDEKAKRGRESNGWIELTSFAKQLAYNCGIRSVEFQGFVNSTSELP
jgi:hypothetical protein